MKKFVMVLLLPLAGPVFAQVPFDKIDTNQDGMISPDELQNAIASGMDDDGFLAEINWEADDADGNGSLSSSEYDQAIVNIKD